MNNPIQVFETIRDNFILYLETAFGTKYSDFETERHQLMKRDKVFARAPWVEPLPTYKESDFTIDEIPAIPNLNEDELAIFKNIAKAGLFGNNKLYEHQWKMLTQAMEGKHCVITSGTGSGKTESFLLPLFAYLSKEMNTWKAHSNNVNNYDWWGTNRQFTINANGTMTDRVKQRPNLNRPAAVRAMVIYPMNALVEDQLSRLRKALDSDDARNVLTEKYNNNRIYFGRYNGTSPVSGKLLKEDGERNDFTIKRLKKEIRAIQDNLNNVNEYIHINPENKTPNELKELLANFQRLDGAEMRTRFDMQETPPDILITNFSMLSIILMREIDNPLLEKTKEWLSCTTEFDNALTGPQKEEEKKNRIFHIIIDELHLYRGGSGTETAYLIRMLLNRLGLSPDSDQLRILASSASLDGNEGRLFLQSFFGTENKDIRIIEGPDSNIEIYGEKSSYTLGTDDYNCLSERISNIENHVFPIEKELSNKIKEIKDNQNISEKEKKEQIKSASQEKFNSAILVSTTIYERFEALLEEVKNQSVELNKRIYSAFKSADGRVRAIPAFKNGEGDQTEGIISLAEALFGDANQIEAVKAFLYILGLFERFNIETIFPRLRFHLFYRNIGGLWAELKSDSEMAANPNTMPIANLMTTPSLISNNKRTLELLYCENCGTVAYGGNRIDTLDEQGHKITELLPLSADIEGVPETSPATIVEKRKYIDFSVFYPGDFYNGAADPENLIPTTRGFKADWQEAWINVKSGIIKLHDPNDKDNFIKGLWYRVKDDGVDIKHIINQTNTIKEVGALPCLCPNCKADYSHPKKKKHSPFRGFRTGFGKVSQILAKELFKDLPDGESTKKLVAFSDSREDAAKLAKNIEEEHFTALLKEVIIHNLTKTLQFDNNVITAHETNNQEEKDRLRNENDAKYTEIAQLFTLVDAGIAKPNQKQNLANIKANIKETRELVDIVLREMLKFGVNPAGPLPSLKNFRSDNIYIPWFQFYNIDFQNNQFEFNTTISNWENARDKTIRQIEENITGLIFGKLFYSFEASGLGYASINKDVTNEAINLEINPDILKEICNSFLRIWGDSYRHNRSDYQVEPYENYEAIPWNAKRNRGKRERKYIVKVAELLRKDEVALGNAVYSILANSQHRGLVEINNLLIKIVGRTDKYYKCPTCGTIHLHSSAGVCIFCLNDLNPNPEPETVENLWNKNYLTFNLNKDYKPFRLHTEELSGQTDDQLTRQREFKNIILNAAEKKIKAIDLLSVTTTLEVGVDIGSLQAILLANMPPQRFNYQQRVGRTGRRGQMFSYALTIARGRSHDEYYFENPISITGDTPPQPFLSLGQEQVFKRVLAKSILQSAFRSFGLNKGSVHGEFGSIQEFRNTNQDLLSTYLNKHIDGSVMILFNSLNKGIYVGGNLQPYIFDAIRQWILDLPLLIISKIDGSSNTNMDLSEFLAENGILPLQGMPTRVRNLIHGFKPVGKNEGYEATVMDRDLGVAIYDYAPGSQKTKDKGVVQSVGFTPDITGIKYNPVVKQMEAETLQIDAFTSRVWMKQNNSTLQLKTHIYDNQNAQENYGKPPEEDGFSIFLGATPAAFRTDFKYPKDSNEDFDINFSKPLTFATSEDTDTQAHQINSAKFSYSPLDTTWKINNNGKKQFTGKYFNDTKEGADLPKQWLDNNFSNGYNPLPDNQQKFLQGNNEETLSIVSGKVTEVFRLEPDNFPLSIEIDPFSQNPFKASSSKGAFYSASFLLQRTLAANLDVDPEEIEIAAIESMDLPEVDGITGRKSARIVLTDELPNGSGFVKRLYEEFPYYLERCINPREDVVEEKYNYNILQNRNCKDASYQDLKNYRNMSFHPLLDWRLAVGLLRLMSDNTYKSGLRNDDYQKPELMDWKEFAVELRDKFVTSFSNMSGTTFGELPGIIFMDDFKVIIVHPFWNYSSHQPEENILTEAIAAAGIENLYFIDTFNLHRRESWCYEQLITKIQENQ
ncbi:MAG: DEAD/DEAH box helicase [Bacteroidetes bacterium]|nr:DEAD/DEAH box helicase [Bacteroidota bacterium]